MDILFQLLLSADAAVGIHRNFVFVLDAASNVAIAGNVLIKVRKKAFRVCTCLSM